MTGFSHHLPSCKLIDLYEEPTQERDDEIQKKQVDYQNCKALTQKPLLTNFPYASSVHI